MPINSIGIFLPKLVARIPNTIFENIPPTESSEVTQLAASIVILPVGNGDLSDVSRIFIGLDHPSNMPNWIMKRFTGKLKQGPQKSSTIFNATNILFCLNYRPTNPAKYWRKTLLLTKHQLVFSIFFLDKIKIATNQRTLQIEVWECYYKHIFFRATVGGCNHYCHSSTSFKMLIN